MQFARSVFYLAVLLLGFSGAAISLRVDGNGSDAPQDKASDPARTQRKNPALSEQRVANGDWVDNLRSENFWRQLRSPQSRPDAAPRRALNPSRSEAPRRSSATPRDEDARSRTLKGQDGGSYRTVCVRLCDGYFWPVSFAAGRTSLEQDQRKCEQSCESPVRLYTAKDAEAPLEEMRDANGRYYRDLKTAFVYRSSYLGNCKCRAHPWEAEAQARHAGYAQEVKPNRRQR